MNTKKTKIVEIQINSNPSHIITGIQFPIQLVVGHINHQTQDLTLDHLAFDQLL
jgi:hypothetical protein